MESLGRIAFVDYANYHFIRRTVAEISARGFLIHYIYSADFTSPNRRMADAAQHEIAIRDNFNFDKENLARRLAYEVRWARKCRMVLDTLQPATVSITNAPLTVVHAVLDWARTNGARSVFWVQDFHAEAVARLVAARSGVTTALRHGLTTWESLLLRRSDSVLTIAPSHRDHAIGLGATPSKVRVLPNWAVLEDIPPLPRQNDWARARNLEDSENVVYTGTLGRKHNVETLAHLARRLRERPRARLIVVSEGAGAEALSEIGAERGLSNLMVLPFQPSADFPAVLATADVLTAVLTHDASAFSVPSKILAYLCAGRPIICSMPASNDAAALLLNTGTGAVVSPGNSDAYADAIMALLADRNQRYRMGALGRTYAENTFALNSAADRLLTAISD